MSLPVLILGGTTEARALAGRLAERGDCAVTLSLAGRTRAPAAQGVPVRVGGFGGAGGLAAHLRSSDTALLIDATHPFAAQISRNAVEAAAATGVPLLALRRPAWEAVAGDRWFEVESVAEAVGGLGQAPRRVFAALGRQELEPIEDAPQHFWLVRSVDPVEPKLRVPDAAYVLDRGPFPLDAERLLLREHRIDAVLCKNSGGTASAAKLQAARELSLPVFMVRRPTSAGGEAVGSVGEAVAWVGQRLASAKRGA